MYQETIISNSIITNIRLSDGAYRLHNLLLSMAYGDKIQVYPSEKYLAVCLGRSIRTIQRYLRELIQAGLISIRRRGSTSNLYTLLQKRTKQVGERVANTIKKAVTCSKTQNKAINNNKSSKQSNWNINHRNYDFNKLEQALVYGTNCTYEELLE